MTTPPRINVRTLRCGMPLITEVMGGMKSAAISWSNLTSSGAFDAVMIYSTTDTNRNLGVFTFGSQSITAGTLTLNMPTNDASTGLIRFA